MVVSTQYLIINIVALFVIVIIAYLTIQCYKTIKEILKDDNETFED